MTLATRCSACGTSFRVVQDQLKVSGGWVRCGRCNEVFNALEGLYEIYTQPGELSGLPARGGSPSPVPAPTAAPAPSPAPSPDPATSPVQSGSIPLAARGASSPTPGAAAWSTPSAAGGFRVPPPSFDTLPDSSPHDATAGWAESASPDASGANPVPAAAHAAASAGAGAGTWPAAGADTVQIAPDDATAHAFDDVETRLEPRPGEEGGPMPSFMQGKAEGEAQAPPSLGQRLMWATAGGVLMLLLVGQLALAYRDLVVSRWPAARPVLVEACGVIGCRVEPLRRMSALSVEGSNLRQRATEGSYELLVNLRNRSDVALLLPAFELTLTDTQGQPLVRRVLRGREIGAKADTIGAGQELSLQAPLDIADRRVAGYTVEIFYP